MGNYKERVKRRLVGEPMMARPRLPWWFTKWPWERPNPMLDFSRCYVLREDGIDFSEEKDL